MDGMSNLLEVFLAYKAKSNNWLSKFKVVRCSYWSTPKVSFMASLVRDIHQRAAKQN